jgi:dolichol-phosphate mannosyltransferase
LGAAYIRGMSYALDRLDADAVMEMDADFSHKPEDIPRLFTAFSEGADFVIGSRYVPGGSIPEEWAMWRRMNSRFGNIVARYLAGLGKVHDCTAGFRLIRASLLRELDLQTIKVQGYAFQIALLHRALSLGAVVRELPVQFVDRTQGDSKLGLRDIVEFVINAWWIRLQSSRTFAKFAVVGASGVIVNLGSFTLLLELGMNQYLASPIAIEISIITNFLLNNFWTFRRRRNADGLRIRGLKFNVVSLLALLVSYSAFVISAQLLPQQPPQLHQAIGILPALLVNYFLNSYWTFKNAP